MTNGNDWQQQPGDGGQGNQNVPQTTGDRNGGSEDWDSGGMSPIGEGWGEGAASFDEVIDNVKAFLAAFKGDVMMAWLVFAGIGLLLTTLGVTVDFFAWLLSEATGFIGGLFGLLTLPLDVLIALGSVLLTAGQLTLYGPMREKLFHGVEPGGWMAALKTGMNRFIPVALAIGAIALVIPLTCFIPGLVLAFFAIMAPYLLASRQLKLDEAFKQSYELAKEYWQVFAVTIGALMGGALVAGCVIAIAQGMMMILPAPLSGIVGSYATWFAVTLLQIGIFIVWGGVFATVDSHESGEAIRRQG